MTTRTKRLCVECLEDRTTPSVAFFLADDGIHGQELWRTDGTAAGTALFKDINPGPAGSGILRMTDVNGTLYFTANDGVHGRELWKSDGTAAGTVMVKDINPGIAGGLDFYGFEAAGLVYYNGALYFRATDGSNGFELWRSDGTAGGTEMVKDVNKGSRDGRPSELTVMNGSLYFEAEDTKNGWELWRSDGTAAGTVLVKDIYKGSQGGHPHGLIAVGNTLYFSAADNKNGRELWKSDGTAAGTVMVKDINPNSFSIQSAFISRIAVGNTLYFAADDGVHGEELWKTDGTAAGTVLVADIYPGAGSSFPRNLATANGQLYFTAKDQSEVFKLWTSNGTAAGTTVFLDTAFNGSHGYTHVQLIDGRLYISGAGLLSSDGTQAGTTLLHSGGGGPVAALNGQVIFGAYDPDRGTELWLTDGTGEGTLLLADIQPGENGSFPTDFVVMG